MLFTRRHVHYFEFLSSAFFSQKKKSFQYPRTDPGQFTKARTFHHVDLFI